MRPHRSAHNAVSGVPVPDALKPSLGARSPRTTARYERFFACGETALVPLPVLPAGYGPSPGHPTPEHRAIGAPTKAARRHSKTTFEGVLSCTTCHDPHKGASRGLFRWGASSSMEACIHCHPK